MSTQLETVLFYVCFGGIAIIGFLQPKLTGKNPTKKVYMAGLITSIVIAISSLLLAIFVPMWLGMLLLTLLFVGLTVSYSYRLSKI